MPGRSPKRLLDRLTSTDAHPAAVRAVRATRHVLPGDPQFGDELSTADGRPTQLLARYLAETGDARPSAVREAGLTALQVWQALSQATGRGAGEQEVSLLFTDLVDFSKWVLAVGDEAALELLRAVAGVVEPAVRDHGGRIVKRLGDGHMAVFADPGAAVAAALDAQARLTSVEVEGHTPQLRAGVHHGRPRRLAGDYLGVDVNIAARVAAAARGGEVLVSGPALDALDAEGLTVRRRRWFRAKGTPRELEVYAVARDA